MKNLPSFLVIGVSLFLGAAGGAWWMSGQKSAADEGKETAPGRMKASNRDERMMESPVERSRRITQEREQKEKDEREAKQKAVKESLARIDPLVREVLQLDDAEKRSAALEKIRAMMADGDPAKAGDGIRAFLSLYDVEFDKASFRPLVLPHLKAENDELREMAWSALLMAGLKPEDSALMREVARTTGMGDRTSYFLMQMEKGNLKGESGAIVRDLLDPSDAGKTREVMRGIWGASFSPELESRIVEVSREGGSFFYDAVYYAMSTQENKGPETVARLIDAMQEPDMSMAGRAAWGLTRGVPKEMSPQVADAAIKVISSRGSGYLGEQAWRMLDNYVSASNLPALKELAAKPNLGTEQRGKVQEMIRRIEPVN